MTAQEELTRALVEMAARRERPRCSDPDDSNQWTSERAEDRARAAQLCTGCPILTECRAAAEEADEKWFVFGGIDYRTINRKKRAA